MVSEKLARFAFFKIVFINSKRYIEFYTIDKELIDTVSCEHLLNLVNVVGSEGPDSCMCEDLGSIRLLSKFNVYTLIPKELLYAVESSEMIEQQNNTIIMNLCNGKKSDVLTTEILVAHKILEMKMEFARTIERFTCNLVNMQKLMATMLDDIRNSVNKMH